MAHTFRVTAPGLPPKLIMDSRIGESDRHVVLKVLGWLLFWRPDLQVEKSADQHYQPDLIAGEDLRRPDLWIDCGDTTLKKLDKISTTNSRALIVLVKAERSEMVRYAAMAEKKIRRNERVAYVAFDPGFVDGLGAKLGRTNELTFSVDRTALSLDITLNATPFRSAVHILPGPERLGWADADE
jgi:uncharacterized protein YaeQ